MIQSPEELYLDGLEQQVQVGEGETLDWCAGRLFSGKPVTLILDLRAMNLQQLPELNELFDPAPQIEWQTFGEPSKNRFAVVQGDVER